MLTHSYNKSRAAVVEAPSLIQARSSAWPSPSEPSTSSLAEISVRPSFLVDLTPSGLGLALHSPETTWSPYTLLILHFLLPKMQQHPQQIRWRHQWFSFPQLTITGDVRSSESYELSWRLPKNQIALRLWRHSEYYFNHNTFDTVLSSNAPSKSPLTPYFKLQPIVSIDWSLIAHDSFTNSRFGDVWLEQNPSFHRSCATMWFWHILEYPAPIRQWYSILTLQTAWNQGQSQGRHDPRRPYKAPNMCEDQWLTPKPYLNQLEVIKQCIKPHHDIQYGRPQTCWTFLARLFQHPPT